LTIYVAPETRHGFLRLVVSAAEPGIEAATEKPEAKRKPRHRRTPKAENRDPEVAETSHPDKPETDVEQKKKTRRSARKPKSGKSEEPAAVQVEHSKKVLRSRPGFARFWLVQHIIIHILNGRKIYQMAIKYTK
jgi:hypothetical protein